MRKKMKKLFVVCSAAAAMSAVMPLTAFAKVHIGSTTYDTFDEAVTAAADGDVIVLDTDETTAGMELKKNLVVDGGSEKRKLTFTDKGIALWGTSLTLKNCEAAINGIGATPYSEWSWMTICASANASLNLEHAKLTLDGTGTAEKTHAIYFCSNNKLNLKDSTLEIRNYPQDALEWDGGDEGYNVNLESSTYISDHNRSGFTGIFYATIGQKSNVQVTNSLGNGSNGTYYTIKNGSDVLFEGNHAWGISAWRIDMSEKSTLTAKNNGYSGVWTRVLNVDKTCKLDVEQNGTSAPNASTNAGILFYGNKDHKSVIEKGADVTIMNNAGSGIRAGQTACDLTIGSANILNNGTGTQNQDGIGADFGGGIYNLGTMKLGASVALYNNHATKGADDIYNGDGAAIEFRKTNKEWLLDDCDPYHAIDGWYDDAEGTRWNAHGGESERHMILVTSGTKSGMLQVKAAHGADAEEKESHPDLDKKANGEDEIEGVKPGEVINFTLESHLPARLAAYAVRSDSDAEKIYIPAKFSERMIFHDVMSKNLNFDQETLKVTVGKDERELPKEYYKVETGKDGETFRVSIYLIPAFNDGYITYEELKNAEPIVVSYDASVSKDAIDGEEVENRAWVNDSEIDIVEGPVIDPDVPITGGMGTGIFTAAGIALMGAAAGTVIVTGKRKKNRE